MYKKIVLAVFWTLFFVSSAIAQDNTAGKLTDFDESPETEESEAEESGPPESTDPLLENNETLAGMDEPGIGMSTELMMSMLLLDVPDGYDTRLVFGGSLAWHVGRNLFKPENEFWRNSLYLDATYLYTGSTDGTQMVKVSTSYHYLTTSVLWGYPLGKFLLYGKVGPSLTILPVSYRLRDSLRSNAQENTTEYRDYQWGVAFGIGARAMFYLSDHLGIAGRLEIQQLRRSYFNDTFINLGVGLAF